LSGQQSAGASPLVAGDPRPLASDAVRDRTADLLNTAFAEGRLTPDEHSERVGTAYAARTWQQLRRLTEDLPAQDRAATGRAVTPEMVARPDRCLLLIACPPAGVAWLLISRRRSRGHPDRGMAAAGGLGHVDAASAGRRALRQEAGYAEDR
jgi:DUF1707 SHOCT-like domain